MLYPQNVDKACFVYKSLLYYQKDYVRKGHDIIEFNGSCSTYGNKIMGCG